MCTKQKKGTWKQKRRKITVMNKPLDCTIYVINSGKCSNIWFRRHPFQKAFGSLHSVLSIILTISVLCSLLMASCPKTEKCGGIRLLKRNLENEWIFVCMKVFSLVFRRKRFCILRKTLWYTSRSMFIIFLKLVFC